MTVNKRVVLNSIPEYGFPVPGETTKLVSEEIDLENVTLHGGILTKNIAISLDPYMRGRIRPADVKSYSPPFEVGQPLNNFSVAEVVRSEDDTFKKGDIVQGITIGLESYSVLHGDKLKAISHIDKKFDVPLTYWLGAAGMPGWTAYMSIREYIGEFEKGKSLFVSSAAGAVGTLVCQLAKQAGVRVIGSAGGDTKVKYLLNELKLDAAFDYKTSDPAKELHKFAGDKGIDYYFDNVGGVQLDAYLENAAVGGKVIICGFIAGYNAKEQDVIKNASQILVKQLQVSGFIVTNLVPRWKHDFETKFLPLLGKEIVVKEHRTIGIENAEAAFAGLFKGENFGKAIVVIDTERKL